MFTFDFGTFPTWKLQIATQSDDIILKFNLAALALIIFINKLKKRILPEQEIQVLAIGEEVTENNLL